MIELPAGLKDLVIDGFSVVVVIYGVIDALKQAAYVKNEQAPMVALGVGTVMSVAYFLSPSLTGVVVRGLGLGTAAMIGYAGFKKHADESSDAEYVVVDIDASEGKGEDAKE